MPVGHRGSNGTNGPAVSTTKTPGVRQLPSDPISHQASDRDHEQDSHQGEELGSVKIARRVLRTVVEQAVLGVRGVTRMAGIRNDWPHLLGRPLPQHGVSLTIRDTMVAVELYLIAQPGVSLVDVGIEVQEAVMAAVERILGMGVSEINVYIQDVA